MTNDSALAALREDLALCLPSLLRDALAQYREFAACEPPEDAKGFAAHQAACKSALGHIEALLKLNHGLKLPPTATSTSVEDDCMDLIREAEAYLDELTTTSAGGADD